MNTQHTTGPWYAMPMHQECFTLIWADTKNESLPIPCIARLPWPGHTESNELEANVRLIASAPSLLEALHEIADNLTHAFGGESQMPIFERQLYNSARHAIAKATGGAA